MSNPSQQTQILAEGMRSAVKSYRSGDLRIDQLLNELRSRIAMLGEFGDESWADELKSHWNRIEYVNAFFIKSGRGNLDPDEERAVDEALDELMAELETR